MCMKAGVSCLLWHFRHAEQPVMCWWRTNAYRYRKALFNHMKSDISCTQVQNELLWRQLHAAFEPVHLACGADQNCCSKRFALLRPPICLYNTAWHMCSMVRVTWYKKPQHCALWVEYFASAGLLWCCCSILNTVSSPLPCQWLWCILPG